MHSSPMIKQSLEYFEMTKRNVSKTLLPDGFDLSLGPKDVASNTTFYRNVIISLPNLSITVRSGIAIAVRFFQDLSSIILRRS